MNVNQYKGLVAAFILLISMGFDIASQERIKSDEVTRITSDQKPSNVDSTESVCNPKDFHNRQTVNVKDIVGMYRQSVKGLPAYMYPSDEKRTGYNYLAITEIGGNKLRIRLTTKEINGHDCGFDNNAIMCGQAIMIIPSQEETNALQRAKQSIPRLIISSRSIEFTPDTTGSYAGSQTYCGQRGRLDHRFSRISRRSKIDLSVFN
jgi:hypothetical protein